MRFLPAGPDVPQKLITLQEKGGTIFVCGAGVSRAVGLPSFRGLVEHVYHELGEDWRRHHAERECMSEAGRLAHQYDRVLRSLERRLAASDLPKNRGMRGRIRTAVRNALSPKNGVDYSNHRALLELSRDHEGNSRLLTTNFDTLFERAWFEKYGARIPSHAGPAMPQPNVSDFAGVLHLHGRLLDEHSELALEETSLVLTSAEFGDAYLRSGWASRYVYDIVRAFTVVLVGYEADDPPMRYLLEAMEADRERYPDLQSVYAFASASSDADEDFVQALWQAKGVEPIIYRSNTDHSVLYDTLREWQKYAGDPTAWRREHLRKIFNSDPGSTPPESLQECMALLGHGDASQLLHELSPTAAWLPTLAAGDVFSSGRADPGDWIATRVDEASMIRACAALGPLSEKSRWPIERAISQRSKALGSTRRRAWQLLLSMRSDLGHADPWYSAVMGIRHGSIGHIERQIVRRVLQPRLKISKPFGSEEEERDGEAETLDQLLRLSFESTGDPQPSDIIKVWPQDQEEDAALFRVLERGLVEALEEAADVGYLSGWDRTSSDVPSVAHHEQNAHHSGFYPLTRCISDLWHRIAFKSPEVARMLVSSWEHSPYLLIRRMHLDALSSREIFVADEVTHALAQLDDRTFWLTGAQVEIMKLVTQRWGDFSPTNRALLEERLRNGLPRSLFPDSSCDEERWGSIQDSSVFKRLMRIVASGVTLSDETKHSLDEIKTRHPGWTPNTGDRDDFHIWHESRSGPDGHPEVLANVADEKLVAEGMRLQREQRFEQGDLWRVFCSSDPERALRGLQSDAQASRWDVEAWRCLLWAAADTTIASFQIRLGGQLIALPDTILGKLMSSAGSWLQRTRQLLVSSSSGESDFLTVWDRFADLTYSGVEAEAEADDDWNSRALSEPGGVLAWVLYDQIAYSQPKVGEGFSPLHKPRLTRAVEAHGSAGLLARVFLTRSLAYLDAIDPTWTAEHLIQRFALAQEASALWQARAYDRPGSARLFNALKPYMLEAFESGALPEDGLEGLLTQLLSIAVTHQQGLGQEFSLTTGEVKQALTACPSATRSDASWQFWRWMLDENQFSLDKADRWRQIIGPLFQAVWPLGASLRNGNISKNLVLMVLECDDEFENAVEVISDFIVPYRMYESLGFLCLESAHKALLQKFPRHFLQLANLLIDPNIAPLPSDIAEFLEACVEADASVVKERAYLRLFALRRQQGA